MARKDVVSRQKPPDARIERQIITGLIISDQFAKEVIPIYTPESLRLDYARTIAEWCVEYYGEYGEAPGKNIQDIYQTKVKSNLLDPERAEDVEDFLTSISEEYEADEAFNVKYVIDKAERHFKISSLQKHKADITKSIISGRVEEAEAAIANYRRVARVSSKSTRPLTDKEAVVSAFQKNIPLFTLPGALGRAISGFQRGFLGAVVGSSGSGKTWWLMWIAILAARAGFKVLFLSLEMSKEKIIFRIFHSILAAVTKSKYEKEPIHSPIFDCYHNQIGECKMKDRAGDVDVVDEEFENEEGNTEYKLYTYEFAPEDYKPCTHCRGRGGDGGKSYKAAIWWKESKRKLITPITALKKMKSMKRGNWLRGGDLVIEEFPSNTLTIKDFKAYLDNKEYYDGFEPDFIITDYADKFAPENPQQQYRHQLNDIWEAHKAIAQERNCVVVTASQSNTSRTGKTIKQGDWAEDIRKLNLVDMAWSINQTPAERRLGLTRSIIMKSRHEEFDQMRDIWILSDLRIGRPYIDSHDPMGG